jgi:hypothetical protein
MTLRSFTLAAALLMLTSSWALGAGSLEAVRSTARAAREQVSQLRASQLTQRNELSKVSQRVEQLKVGQRGTLTPGSELDLALKRSQELSGVLSALAQQMSLRESELESANLALLDALTGELSRLRADFDRQTDRGVRRGLIEQLKKLRGEREALRATLPVARLPVLSTVTPSDDPTELLEQADLLRDNQEKVQKELKTLEVRIAERRQEAELDSRVQRFMGEESMFDEQDRRLRVQRTTPLEAPAATAAEGTSRAASAPGPDTAGGGYNGAAFSDPATPEAVRGSVDNQSGVQVINGSDARPQLGGARTVAVGDDDLEGLEAEQAKLRGRAAALKQQADELERRAADLR